MRRLGIWVGAPVGGLEEDEAFCETTHNICVKIQQTTVAVTRVDILNDITSIILGGHYHGCPPSYILGNMSPLSHRDRRPCCRRYLSTKV